MDLLSRLTARPVYLDTNIFIYALEGFAAFEGVLSALFAAIDRRAVRAVTSELTLAEALVKPFRDANTQHQDVYRQAIQSRGGLAVLPVTRDDLVGAARLRGTSGVSLPDAIHLATALRGGCTVFLSNDARLRAEGLEVLSLSDFRQP